MYIIFDHLKLRFGGNQTEIQIKNSVSAAF